MPFINSETVKEIRKEIKKEFPKFKFSITTRNYSSVCVDIMRGNIEFKESEITGSGVSEGWLKEHWGHNLEAVEMFKKIFEIINSKKEQKESSYDGDYGSIPNFYINVCVGKWNKAYEKIA